MIRFGNKKPESPAPEALPIIRPACSCGSRYFTAGGSACSPACDGKSAWLEATGGVLTCLACGKRWYTTPDGLREPHRDAMPPAWAAQDMQRAVAEARVAAASDGQRTIPKRPIEREFKRPPRPV